MKKYKINSYCLLKIPLSENKIVKKSYLAYLIRNINSKTKKDVLEIAKLIAYSDNRFLVNCEKVNCKDCDIFKEYKNKTTL
ncbi:MAG: hypothetical protein QXD43_01245 [Candidatus Aenigmatarchaeota archaeon]